MSNEPSFLKKELVLPSQLSQDMIQLAQEVNDKYPNLSIAWIPPENRGEGDDRPFAIVQINAEGEIQHIILRMHQLEVHGAYVFNWLWANDSQRVDPWNKYLLNLESERVAREKKDREIIDRKAEVINSIAKSPLHTYKINGRKIGTDNYEPRIGENAS